MFEVLCAMAVIYVAVDLLGSAYLIRRYGGLKATLRLIRNQQGWDDDENACDCDC